MAVLLGLVACPALASADDGARVDALYQEAKKDLTEGRYPFALQKFRRGIELAGTDRKRVWRMMLGIALSYDEMLQQEYSIEYYRRFLDDIMAHPDQVDAKWDKRRKVVEVQVVQLEAQLLGSRGVVTFNTDPSGARVMVDGGALGSEGKAETPVTAYLRGGEHEVRLVRDGSVPAKMRLVVEQGRRRTVNVPLEPIVKAPVVHTPPLLDPVVPPPALIHQTEGARIAPLWGYIGAGTAGALLAGGVVFTALAHGTGGDLAALDREIDEDKTLLADEATMNRHRGLKDDVQQQETLAAVFYGVGGAAAAGAAVYLVFLADWDDASAHAGLPILPGRGVVVPYAHAGAGLTMTWTW
jgi:hypothetical protein